MARMLSYSATALDAGERLDSLLAARACFASRSAAARAIVLLPAPEGPSMATENGLSIPNDQLLREFAAT